MTIASEIYYVAVHKPNLALMYRTKESINTQNVTIIIKNMYSNFELLWQRRWTTFRHQTGFTKLCISMSNMKHILQFCCLPLRFLSLFISIPLLGGILFISLGELFYSGIIVQHFEIILLNMTV